MIALCLNPGPFTSDPYWAEIKALGDFAYRSGYGVNPLTKKLDKAPLRRLALEAQGKTLYFQYEYSVSLTEIENRAAYRDAVDYLKARHPDVIPCYRNEPGILSQQNADISPLVSSCLAANQGYAGAITYTTHGYFTDRHETFEWPREIERTEFRYQRVARPDASVHIYTRLDPRPHIPHPLEQARQKALLAKKYGMSLCTETGIYSGDQSDQYLLGLLTGLQARVIAEILSLSTVFASKIDEPGKHFGLIGKPSKVQGLMAGLA